MFAAVNALVDEISLNHKRVFLPIFVDFKQTEAARTIHIMLNCSDIYGYCHSFLISSTPSGRLSSTVII